MTRATCARCKKPEVVCYCHTLQTVANHWPVHILQHPNEARHAIGTARIAALSLVNCTLEIGNAFSKSSTALLFKSRPLLVYPSANALPLESLQGTQPRPLIILDASWKKSRRILHESPILNTLQTVSFASQKTSRYQIRKEPKPGYLSTLEAIVHALSTLEKDAAKYQPLLDTMDYMIQRQIEHMQPDVFTRRYKK